MAAISLMRVIVAAVLMDLVSARLGTNGEMMVNSYFGEVAVVPTPINAAASAEATATEAPKPAIIMTQSALRSVGVTLKAPAEAEQAEGGLEKVCEKTRQALSGQASGSGMPGGAVYKECMAALAPLRQNMQQDSDAVDTLSDCMALVNALVANKGGDCHDAVAVLQAQKPQPVVAATAPRALVAKPSTVKAAAPKPAALSKEVIAKQEAQALDLVSEAMNEVCTETVRDAEAGLKSEGDAMNLANAVAPICQANSKKHLGADAAMTSLTKEWCHQLDGRLTIALETGFFFAVTPDEAERQAAEANPYAATTRRKFCNRFVNSLRKQAKEGGLYLNSPPPSASSSPVTAPAATNPVQSFGAIVAEVAPPAPLPTLPPAPKSAPPAALPTLPPAPKASAEVQAPPAEPQSPAAAQATGAEVKQEKPATSAPTGSATDMLRLVQALSGREEWNAACTTLVSKLSSEEGSVTEEYALGSRETGDGTKVLTFNSDDQGQIRKCAAQLKVLAIQSGILGGSAEKASALISLSSADDAEEVMDSPWAADACGDIAHGYLTARLAHPGLEVADFCPLYAKDLHAMHSSLPAAAQAEQEKQQLRKRGKRLMAQAQTTAKQSLRASTAPAVPVAPAAPAAPVATVQDKRSPTAALITETSNVEDKEGMDFWRGMLQ